MKVFLIFSSRKSLRRIVTLFLLESDVVRPPHACNASTKVAGLDASKASAAKSSASVDFAWSGFSAITSSSIWLGVSGPITH